jgi:hypothetical protein
MREWPFSVAPETTVRAHPRLFTEDDWVAYVVHETGGAWRFHVPDIAWLAGEMLEVSLGRLLVIDESLALLADLPPGWHAWRAARDEPWQRAPL